jgi:hypothetical protein
VEVGAVEATWRYCKKGRQTSTEVLTQEDFYQLIGDKHGLSRSDGVYIGLVFGEGPHGCLGSVPSEQGMVTVQHPGHVHISRVIELASIQRHGDYVFTRDTPLIAKVALAVWVGPTWSPDVAGEAMEKDELARGRFGGGRHNSNGGAEIRKDFVFQVFNLGRAVFDPPFRINYTVGLTDVVLRESQWVSGGVAIPRLKGEVCGDCRHGVLTKKSRCNRVAEDSISRSAATVLWLCYLAAAACAVAHVFPPPKGGGGTFNALGLCTPAVPPRITKVMGA